MPVQKSLVLPATHSSAILPCAKRTILKFTESITKLVLP